MVDISSGDKKINITVSTSGNKASVNATSDTAMYYSNKSREWAISDKIVDNEDYSSKYYANVSKQNADKSTVNLENLTTNYNQYKNELENIKDSSVEEITTLNTSSLAEIETAKAGALTDIDTLHVNSVNDIANLKNTSLSDIETSKTNAITDIVNQETLSVDNVNTAGSTQVNNVNTAGTNQVNLAKEQVTLATNQATIATTQAGIATAKTSEVVESGNNAITAITAQETTSKNNIIAKGTEQIELIQNEGATQVANVQSTGFYMRDDKLYYINSQGEETEFKSGGSGLEVCDIGMSLYVDETKGLRRYINGQIVERNTNTETFFTRLQQITTLHPSLLDTEENWQAAKTLSPFGQVGKFVFNYIGDEIVSVRLPRVVNVQGLFDLQNLGMTVGAGLPNIEGFYHDVIGASGGGGTGAFKKSGYVNANAYSGNTVGWHQQLTFNASDSNPIYGNSDTVQQEAIQYPYFIQIATGSETENNIINEVELNNPYSLFDSKYSDHELNNLSWLKSEGQWNAKAVYPTVYEGLQVEYNSEIEAGTTVTLPDGLSYTKRGLSVKLSTEEYTDYDFVLNTADETFRLPLKTLHSDDTVDSLSLYFYVGETVQNANLINAGRIGEVLANKVDTSNTKWATNACMPDFSSIITIPWNTSIQLPYDAYVFHKDYSTSYTNYCYTEVSLDNTNWICIGIWGYSAMASSSTVLPKGIYVKCRGGSDRNNYKAWYAPLKGAN